MPWVDSASEAEIQYTLVVHFVKAGGGQPRQTLIATVAAYSLHRETRFKESTHVRKLPYEQANSTYDTHSLVWLPGKSPVRSALS